MDTRTVTRLAALRGFGLSNVRLTTAVADARPPLVLEDVEPVVHPQP